VVHVLDPHARQMLLPILNGLGRFGAYLFENAPTGPTDAVVAQMRRNGHWVLANGVDLEATYRFCLDPHDLGLTVGPTVFEPSATPPDDPDATISSDSVTLTNLFNAGSPSTTPRPPAASTSTATDRSPSPLLVKLTLGP
jgi:hypothetical protein